MHPWGQSEKFPFSTTSTWVVIIICMLGPDILLSLYITLFLFRPFIMFIVWMVHVHSIKFTFHIVLGAPTPILYISVNIFLWFIDTPWLNIFKSLNVTIVGFPSFSTGEGMVSVYSYYLDCYKDRNPTSLTYTDKFLVQEF